MRTAGSTDRKWCMNASTPSIPDPCAASAPGSALILQIALASAPMAVCLLDQGRVIWCNRHLCTYFGHDETAVHGSSLAMLFSDQADWDTAWGVMQPQLRQQGRAALETSMRDKTGGRVDVLLNLAHLPEALDAGDMIAWITDISDQKAQGRTLVEQGKRYKELFDNAPVGILRTDMQGNIIHMNQALALMIGYTSPDEALHGLSGTIANVYENAEEREALIRELKEHGQIRDRETRSLGRYGQVRIVNFSMRCLVEDGKEYIDGFITDISERKRAEQEAKLHEEQLLQVNKLVTLGTLTAGVAHEVNNPNNFIAINAPMLEKAWQGLEPVLDDIQARQGDFMVGNIPYSRLRLHVPKLIQGIVSGSRRIQAIVENMKSYARPTSPEPFNEINLNEVVHAALGLIKVRAVKAGCRITESYAANLPPVMGNAHQIEQVVLNLVLNGIEALPAQGSAVEVKTCRASGRGQVCLCVRDQGCGIDESVLKHIYDPFFTTKKARGGTGLGLAISRTVALAHGGDLEVRNSSSGRGAVARLYLPVPAHSDVCGQ